MTIWILTEGGPGIGWGHITRCRGLAEELRSRGAAVRFGVNGDGFSLSDLPGGGYELWPWRDRPAEMVGQLHPEDIVVVDSYLADAALYTQIAAAVGDKIASIDDYQRIRYPAGVVINPAVYGDPAQYHLDPAVNVLAGPEYVIVREAFVAGCDKTVRDRIQNVLITFGGCDHAGLAATLAGELTQRLAVQCPVIGGSGRRLEAQEVSRLMQGADVCVSGGGQTLYELAVTGTPAVAVGFAENQRQNVEALEGCGYLEVAGWADEEGLVESAVAAVERLAAPQERSRRSRLGRNLIDGRGTERIFTEVIMPWMF